MGITESYKGFLQTVYAVQLAAGDLSRLQLITKRIYLDVAKQYSTTWNAVERNIRTAAAVAWEHNAELLAKLAGFHLTQKPRNALFLSILANALLA